MSQPSEMQEEPRKVHQIAKDFLVLGDELLAHKMQNEEYNEKYKFNRGERQVARQDVPLAIMAQSEEELKLQKENFERLEKLNKLAEEDAMLARQLQENESATLKRKSKRMEVRPVETVTVSAVVDFGDDLEMNQLIVEKKTLERQKARIQQEIKDQELAIQLHNKEMKKYLSQLGRTTDANGSHSADRRSSQKELINEGKLGGKVISLSKFKGFEVGDDVSEEERKELIRMQDEELARALQKFENEKPGARKHKTSLEMERRDAELAQLVQQAETMHLQEHLSQRMGRAPHDVNMVYATPCCPGGSHPSPGVPCHSNKYMEDSFDHRVCRHHHSVSTNNSVSPPSSINSCEDEAFVHEYENTNRINAKREQTRSHRSSRK